MWNKTSIICTLGPATSKKSTLLKLIAAGLDVARLNFSHGSFKEHQELIRLVRWASAESGRTIGILQDLPGPKLRAGLLPEAGLDIRSGEEIMLAPHEIKGVKTLPFPDRRLLRALKPGADIFLADGLAHLKVLRVKDDQAFCRGLNHALVRSRCGVNIPGGDLAIAAFTRHDRRCLKFGLKEGVDFVAISFVAKAADLRAARKAIGAAKHRPLLVAKIERGAAMDRLPEIVREADAVMVARGDLGVELPLAQVPFAQKEIIAECRRQGRPVIVATQMLESMIANPRPTRAELTDIANAVLDGADAVMLSGETSVGRYPLEAVGTLATVVGEAEKHIAPEIAFDYPFASAKARSIAAAAVALAEGIEAQAVVIPTFTGDTARCVSHLKPRCPILALCASGCEGKMSLLWGVRAYPVPYISKDLEGIISLSRRIAQRTALVNPGGQIVVSCSMPGARFSGDRVVIAVTV